MLALCFRQCFCVPVLCYFVLWAHPNELHYIVCKDVALTTEPQGGHLSSFSLYFAKQWTTSEKQGATGSTEKCSRLVLGAACFFSVKGEGVNIIGLVFYAPAVVV